MIYVVKRVRFRKWYQYRLPFPSFPLFICITLPPLSRNINSGTSPWHVDQAYIQSFPTSESTHSSSSSSYPKSSVKTLPTSKSRGVHFPLLYGPVSPSQRLHYTLSTSANHTLSKPPQVGETYTVITQISSAGAGAGACRPAAFDLGGWRHVSGGYIDRGRGCEGGG